MKFILRLAAFCLLLFAFQVKAQVQSSLENCAGYSVLSLSNTGTVTQSVNVSLNGKVEILTVLPNQSKLYKVKEEALRIDGKSIVAKTSNAALCFSSQLETQYFETNILPPKPETIVRRSTSGGGGNAPLADPVCGNGVQEFGEQCDDGNYSNCDSCTTGCQTRTPAVCGNNTLESNYNCEACDDGNTTSGDGCSSTCRTEQTCGNNIREGFEQCDDGNTNSCDGCSSYCSTETAPACGNGTIDSCANPVEQCDDGNTVSNDGCSATCQNECGNGTIEGVEECDNGTNNGNVGCDYACRIPVCGNSIIQTPEICDDGNTTSGDGCSATCIKECGNGMIDPNEACDDGNYDDNDACDIQCKQNICGNGIKQNYYTNPLDPNQGYTSEQCDDGNTNDNDACSNTCTEAPDMTLTKQAAFIVPQSYGIDQEIANFSTLPSGATFYYIVRVNPGYSVSYSQSNRAFRVQDILPAGVEYISHEMSAFSNGSINGTYNPNTGVWNVTDFVAYDNGFYVKPYAQLLIKVRLVGDVKNCAQVTQYFRSDFDSTPNNMVNNNPVEDDEACHTLFVNEGCSNNLLSTTMRGFEGDPTGTTQVPTTYRGSAALHYPHTSATIYSAGVFPNYENFETAYPQSPLAEPLGIMWIRDGGDPYDGTKFLRLESNGKCFKLNAGVLASTNATKNAVYCFAAAAESATGTAFKVELQGSYGAVGEYNFIAPPSSGDWTDINWNTYCVQVPSTGTNGDRQILVTVGDDNPLLIDGQCLTYEQIQCTNPTTTLSAQDVTCNAGTPNSDAQLTLNGFAGGDRYTLQEGTTFTNTPYFGQSTLIPTNGIILDEIPNPTTPKSYIVRIWRAETCFVDRIISINPKSCACIPSTATASTTEATCNGGTANNNGQITLSGFNSSDRYDFSTGTSYAGGKTYATATAIPVGGVLSNTLSNPSAPQSYTIRIFNIDGCHTDKVVYLQPKTCTLPCSINSFTISPVCNNNSTNNTTADDYRTFSINASGTSVATSYNVSVNNGGTLTPTTGNYGTATAFQLQNGSAGNGTTYTLTLTDATNSSCTQTATISDPGSCSTPDPVCTLNQPITSVACDGKGTPDVSDDTYSYNITVTGSNTASTYGISGGDTQSGLAYGASQGAFGNFLISSGGRTLNITDATSGSCTTTTNLTAPATCSPIQPTCSLSNPITSATCNDNGTPSNPADDTFSYNITVNGNNTGATYGITGGDTRSGLTYGTSQGAFGNFPISGGNLSLNIADVANAGCTTTANVQAPASCSNQVACTMNDPVVVTYCNTNGTASAADDTFGYTITATGTGVSTLYDVMGDDVRNDLAYVTENGPFGWYPLSQGALVLNVIDNVDTSCSNSAVVIAPDDCTFCTDPSGICVDDPNAGTCTITAPNTTGVCNDNGTPSNPADDTFTYSVNVTGTDVGASNQYNLSGGDSRSNLTYGFNQGPFGSFPISGGNLTLTATDADIPACTDGFTVTAPATCSSTPPRADLRVVKTVSSTNVTSGQTITYTITVTNDGPDAATNVQLRDVLSSMLTYVSHTPSVGTYTLGTGIWAIPSLANGANATLMITVTVN